MSSSTTAKRPASKNTGNALDNPKDKGGNDFSVSRSVKPSKANVTLPSSDDMPAPTYEAMKQIKTDLEAHLAEKAQLQMDLSQTKDRLKAAEQRLGRACSVLKRFGVTMTPNP